LGILDKATSVAEDPGSWSILLYGDWGSGKTVFGCQSEKPLLVDTENSRRSLLNHPELVDTPVANCYKSLSKVKQFAIDLKKDKESDVKTVILDTVTSLQFYDMDSIMKGLGEGRDQDLPSQAEFNRNNRRIQRTVQDLLDACRATDRNCVILAHIKEEKDNEGTTTLIRPGTSPALTQAIAPMVDGIFYMEYSADSKGEITRKLRTVPTRKVKAKNRFGTLEAETTNPHFSVIEKAAEKQREVALELLRNKNT
jgi:hypothetical protein